MRTRSPRGLAWAAFLAAMMGVASTARAGYVDAVLADNPMLYWRLGDADKSAGATASNSALTGPLANGVYQGAVGTVTDTALLGDTDSAAHFGVTTAGGANGDQVILNPVPAIPSTEFSAEMWLRADLPAANQQAVISYNAPGSGGENNLLLFKNGGSFNAYVDGPSRATGLPAADLFNGEWNHLAFTWRSSDGQMNTYLNGNLAGSTTHNAGAALNPGGALVLAQEQDGIAGGYSNSQKFVGDLDEVAIYNAVLTPTQVAQHFAANHPLGIPNLQVQLHASDIAGSPGDAVTTWADQSGHHFDATTDGGAATLQTVLVDGTPHNVVRFDGNDGLATDDFVPARGDYTLFVVGSAATTETRGAFLAQDAIGWNNLDTGLGVGPQNVFTTGVANGGPTLETHGPVVGTTNGVAGGASLADGDLRLFTARVEGTSYELGVNGITRSATSTEAGIFGANGSRAMRIGRIQSQFLEGDIADVFVFDRALAPDEFQTIADMLTAKYGLPTPGVAAANISVPATTSNAGSTWTVEQSTPLHVGIGSPPNVGDVEIAVEGFEIKPAAGILMATVREHERDNGYGVRRTTVEVGKGQFGGGVDYLTLSTTEAGYTGSGGIREHNVNVGVAFFPFAEGWTGAHFDPNGTILYANGITQDMLTTTSGTGRHTLAMPGVNSSSGGLLFTIGGSNEDNVVPTGVRSDATWDIRVQDNAAGFNATGERDDFSLLFLPYGTTGLIGGRYNGLNDSMILSVGDPSISREGTGEFRLTVPGHTPQTGTLLLTQSYEVSSGGVTAPDDNIVTYQADGDDFIIHSYDLGGASALQNSQFVFAFIPFDGPPALTPITDPKAVVAGNVAVTGTVDADTFWRVEQTGGDGISVYPTSNRGDVKIGIGSNSLDYQDGVLLATVREADRNGNHISVEAVRTGSWGNDSDMTIATCQAGAGGGGEMNGNVAVAWFPFAGAWTGGHVDASGTLVAGNNVAQSALTPFTAGGSGAYELRLPGVDPATDGMLFTIGGSNEDNIATTQLLADGTGWLVNVQDSNSNISSEPDDFSFLYMPYGLPHLVGGRIDHDAAGTILNASGDFTMAHENSGTYRLSIPGITPDDGMLLLSICDDPGAGYLLPDDNLIHYWADGSDFMIQVRDLPGLGLEATGAGFVFAYIDFDNPPFIPEPTTLTLLALGGFALARRRRRKA